MTRSLLHRYVEPTPLRQDMPSEAEKANEPETKTANEPEAKTTNVPEAKTYEEAEQQKKHREAENMTRSLLHRYVKPTPLRQDMSSEAKTANAPKAETANNPKAKMANEPEAKAYEGAEQQKKQKVVNASTTVHSSHREGDNGLGRPVPPVRLLDRNDLTPVSDSEQNADEEALSEDSLGSSAFTMPTGLCRIARGVLLFAVSAVMFLLVTQTALFLANMARLPVWERVLLAIPLVIFGGLLIWYLVKMLWLCVRLRHSPQIDIKALRELEERRDMRQASLKNNREAVARLADYLKKDFDGQTRVLRALEVPTQLSKELERTRQKLIAEAEAPMGSSRDWIDDFRTQFQNRLDEVALKRIRRYSIHAGIMTGISPFTLIDRLISFSTSLAMLKELLELFALRPSWDKNLVLMGKVIINTYLAGILDEVTEDGVRGLADVAGLATENIPSFAMRLSGKVAETTAQGYMVYRLGRTALKLLHPVCDGRNRNLLSATEKRGSALGK